MTRSRREGVSHLKLPAFLRLVLEKDGKTGGCLETDKPFEQRLALTATLSFFLGRAVLGSSIAPFGPGFYAALRSLGGTGFSLLSALFMILGCVTLFKWEQIVYLFLAVTLLTVFIKPEKESRHREVLDSLVAGLVAFCVRTAIGFFQGPSLYAYISAFIEGLCVLVAGLLSFSAIAGIKESPSSRTARQALLALVLVSVGGLQGLYAFGLDVQMVTIMAGVLAMACVGGPAAGAIAGLSGGLIASLTGSGDPFAPGLLGISGVLAGIGGWFGKAESVLGYLASGLLLSFFAPSGTIVSKRLLEQLVSCAVIPLITSPVKKTLGRYLPELSDESKAKVVPQNPVDPLKLKVAAVSNALSEIGNLFSQAAITMTGSGTAPDRDEIGPNDVESKGGPVTSTIRYLVERVCAECDEMSFCWEEEFGAVYEAFTDLVKKMDLSGRLSIRDNTVLLKDRCHRYGELVSELNHRKEIERLERKISTFDGETRKCLAFQYRCLGQILSVRSISPEPDIRVSTGNRFSGREERFRVRLKGKTIPAEGAQKPGDVWARYDLGPGKTLVVLADGMGKGDLAAKQSRESIEILKSLLDCGLDYDSCVSFLNSALYLAWRPDGFIALDCLLIDHETRRAYFHKLGAPPSFIKKKDGNVLVIRGSTPPAGAATTVPYLGSSEPVEPGDSIFLVSDGVFRSSPVPARAEHLIVSRLSRLKESSLDDSVKALITQSLRYQHKTPPDDVTVVGAMIEGV